MKLKNLVILLAVLTAATGGLLFFKQREAGNASGSSTPSADVKPGELAFKNLDYSQITQVTIHSAKELFTAELKEGNWVLKSKEGLPIGSDRIKDLVKAIALTKISEVQEVGGRFLGQRFKLAKPGTGSPDDETGTLFNFLGADGKVLNAFVLGKSADNGGSYVAYEGVDGKVARTNESFPFMPESGDDWLETFRPNNIKSVSVTGNAPEESWKIFRDNETSGDWKLDAPQAGEDGDSTKMATVSGAFMSPPVKTLIPAADKEKAKFDAPTRKAIIECFDGFTYTITIGAGVAIPAPPVPPVADPTQPAQPNPPAPEPTDYYVTATLEANIPETLPPNPAPVHAPDATEEMKKAADEAHAAAEKTRQDEHAKKLPDLKARAAREKLLSGFQFVMPKTSLDAFFKKRPDFMKDKQPIDGGTGVIPDPSAPPAPSTGIPSPTPGTRIEAVTPPISVDPKDFPKKEEDKKSDDKDKLDPKKKEEPAKDDSKKADKPDKDKKPE